MNQMIKKILQFSVGPIITASLGLILIPLTTYFVAPEEFGRASMFMLAQTIMQSFLYLGFDQAYAREFHQDKRKNRLMYHAMIFPLVLSILMALSFFIFANNLSTLLFGNLGYNRAVYLTGATGIFIVIERFLLLRLQMEERALEFSIKSILTKSGVLIFTLIFLLFIRQDFLAIVYATILGQMLSGIILFIWHKNYLFPEKYQLDKQLIKKLFMFGMPIIFAVGLGSLLVTFDKIALRIWSNFEQLGFFTAVMRIIALLTIVQTAFTSFWLPVAYRWHEEKKEMSNYKMVSDAILALMSIGFVLLLIFRPILMLLLAEEYRQAQYLLGFLTMQPIFYTVSETTTLGIVFSRKTYLNFIVMILAVIASVSLSILLIPNHGALGAAIGTGIAYLVFFWARTLFSFRVWEGFNVSKHVFSTILILGLSFLNIFSGTLVLTINLAALLTIILINKQLLHQLLLLVKKKKR